MSGTNGLATIEPTNITPLPTAERSRGPRLGLPTRDELAILREYGDIVVKSGMAPAHIKTAEAAIVVMRYGAQLGIDEFTALQNMYIIGGKPAAYARLIQSLILRDHGGDAIQIIESTAARCALSCRRRDTGYITEVAYTIDEARQAGIVDTNKVWKQYPKDMLFARAISRAGRQIYMDSTLGMYVPEEIGGDVVEIAGEVITARPVAATVVHESIVPHEPPANRLARLHRVGEERGLDHEALHRVTRFKLPQLKSMAELNDAMANDLATEIETAADGELLVWALDWEAEIKAVEAHGLDGLQNFAGQMKTHGITSKSHPWIAAAWQDAKRRLESKPPTDIVDGQFSAMPGMPPAGDAGDDQYTL